MNKFKLDFSKKKQDYPHMIKIRIDFLKVKQDYPHMI